MHNCHAPPESGRVCLSPLNDPALLTESSHFCASSTGRNHVYRLLCAGYWHICRIVLYFPRDQGEREKLHQQSQAAREDCDRNW